MASTSGDQADLLAPSRECRSVKEPSAPELTEDAMLVGSARNGDRAAFGELYNRYARMVHGVLLARVPACDADDLVQDVFVLALGRLSALREPGSFGAWLAAITRNLANDYYRHSVPEDQLAEDASKNEIARGNLGGDPPGQAAAVLDAIRVLPDAYR
jgi:RNA polymerase sigma-70 factor (ECF subfamily)